MKLAFLILMLGFAPSVVWSFSTNEYLQAPHYFYAIIGIFGAWCRVDWVDYQKEKKEKEKYYKRGGF